MNNATKIEDIIVVIPTLEPTEQLLDLIDSYLNSFSHIIVVDDGSGKQYKHIFKNIEQKGVTVLTHALNYGKGRALKTAFNFILNQHPDCLGIITIDSDGQHLAPDALKLTETFYEDPNCLILGARNFDETHVPFKSRLGNKVTRSIFKLLCGIAVADSQTGLRLFSKEHIQKFLYTTGERFEYETNMLLDAKKHNIKIKEVKISTIYFDNNSGTHFHPLQDSIQIYKSFLKYLFVSLSSFAMDIGFFTLFLKLPFSIFPTVTSVGQANIIARILSSAYNYALNRSLVFEHQHSLFSLLKYYALVLIQMLISTLLVTYIYHRITSSYIVIIKTIVDLCIFVANYYIQREWVFKDVE